VHLVTSHGPSNVVPFGYQTAPAPSGLVAAPTRGPQIGGTQVTLTGHNLDGVNEVTLDGVAAPFVYHPAMPARAAYLTVTTPPTSPGARTLRVQNTAGATTAAFTVVRVPAPAIVTLAPARVNQFGGETVAVTGHNFAGTTGVTVGGAAVAYTLTIATTTTGSDRVTFVAPPHAPGSADVVITTPAGRSPAARLTYAPAALPAITSLIPGAVGYTPGHVGAAGGPVTVSGSNLYRTTGVTVGGAAVPFEQHAAQLLIQVPRHAIGPVPVVVTTLAGASAPATLTVVPSHAPTLTALPSTGVSQVGGPVTVGGTFIDQASAVTVDGTAVSFSVHPPVVTPTQPNQGRWTITFRAPAHAPGRVQVRVTTPAGTAATPLAYVAVPAPTVSSVAPAAVSHWGGRVVQLRGTFLNGATSVTLDGVPVAFTQVGSVPLDPRTSGDVRLQFTAPLHHVGAVQVVVTTPAGTSAPVTLTFE
jgi:hypothetical protein